MMLVRDGRHAPLTPRRDFLPFGKPNFGVDEIAAVTRVDGRVIGRGGPGPVTSRLNELLAALTRETGEVVVS